MEVPKKLVVLIHMCRGIWNICISILLCRSVYARWMLLWMRCFPCKFLIPIILIIYRLIFLSQIHLKKLNLIQKLMIMIIITNLMFNFLEMEMLRSTIFKKAFLLQTFMMKKDTCTGIFWKNFWMNHLRWWKNFKVKKTSEKI